MEPDTSKTTACSVFFFWVELTDWVAEAMLVELSGLQMMKILK